MDYVAHSTRSWWLAFSYDKPFVEFPFHLRWVSSSSSVHLTFFMLVLERLFTKPRRSAEAARKGPGGADRNRRIVAEGAEPPENLPGQVV